MITKGIILGKVVGTNKYAVRVPYFESAGGSQSILEATVSTMPGFSEGYLDGDVVQIAFEDRQAAKAVIVGRLFTLGDDEPRGHANLQDISVSNSATLPKSTMIGNVSGDDLEALVRNASSGEEGQESKALYAHSIRISRADSFVNMNFTIVTGRSEEYTFDTLPKALHDLGYNNAGRTCPASGFYISGSSLKGLVGVYCSSEDPDGATIEYRCIDIASLSDSVMTFRASLSESYGSALMTEYWAFVDVVAPCR